MREPLTEEARQGGDGFGCVQNPALAGRGGNDWDSRKAGYGT
jgi:hypothetical protein